jgi:hypothetical protein
MPKKLPIPTYKQTPKTYKKTNTELRYELFHIKKDKKEVLQFGCTLTCTQCQAKVKDDTQCTRSVCIGLSVCWQHAVSLYHVKIQDAKWLGKRQKGLFAWDPNKNSNEPIFKIGDKIVPYYGENLTTTKAMSRREYKKKDGTTELLPGVYQYAPYGGR